jgi:hypothetical protein
MGRTHPAGLSCHFVGKPHKNRAAHLSILPFFLVLCKLFLTFSDETRQMEQKARKDDAVLSIFVRPQKT